MKQTLNNQAKRSGLALAAVAAFAMLGAGTAQAATPAAWIAATRALVRQRIFATLGDAPYAGVIAALVVGDQRSIPHWF